MVIKTGGRAGGVRDNIVLQPLNGLPGVRTRTSHKRITAPCGFFMCYFRARQTMAGRMGQSKGWPGFLCDRFLTPVRFATRIVRNVVVNSLNTQGATYD